MSTRRCPVLLRQGPLSGEVHAIRRYTRKQINGREVIDAHDKDVVTLDFNAVMLERLFGEDNSLLPLLGEAMCGARDADAITEEDTKRIRAFLDRLKDAITQVNGEIDRRAA